MDSRLLPGVQKTIVESHVMTPNDFGKNYLSPMGTGFSIEPRMFQSAWFRPHNISEEMEGLYLVGAGTHPGPGVPGVIASAEIIAKEIKDAKQYQKENNNFTNSGIQTHSESLKESLSYYTKNLNIDVFNPCSEKNFDKVIPLSLIHISEPTRQY